jgi:hypothetical protein
MFMLTTTSGTKYLIDCTPERPVITRLSEEPIVNLRQATFDREPLLDCDIFYEGIPLRFRTKWGWVTSTPIVTCDILDSIPLEVV